MLMLWQERLTMISYAEALQKVLETVSPLAPVETALSDAAGLVLAAPAIARWDMPRHNNSAMDGFAIAGADIRHVPLRPGVDFFAELEKAIKDSWPRPRMLIG